MATVETILANAYERCEDTGRAATAEALAITICSHMQQVANIHTRSVLSEASLTTDASRTLYELSEASTVARIDSVREGTRELLPATLSDLFTIDTGFLRTTASQFEHFVVLARNLLLIYPAKVGSSSVTVVGPKITTALTATSDAIELQDQHLPLLTDLVTAQMLFKRRHFEALSPLLTQLEQALPLTKGATRAG
jgi:hypothetical protein